MFVDVSACQEKKHGQNAFGDYFLSSRLNDEGRVLAVLSDGLGSGVKASIMARMTATMLLGFMKVEMDVRKAAEIVMNSLPVCRVRGISYATFSMVDCDDEGNARVVEEGNPDFLWFRGDRSMEAPYRLVESRLFPDRLMKQYHFQVRHGDRLVFCSDGVTQAGLGQPGPSCLGLGRQGLEDFLRARLDRHYSIDGSMLAREIVGQAIKLSPGRKPVDDVSAVVVHFRTPRRCVLFTGPPFEKGRDPYYVESFRKYPGRKAICGGTTASLVARELGRDLRVDQGPSSGGLPPMSFMEGVDLVTEGLLTMSRALKYLEADDLGQADPAGSLARFLARHDVIHVMEGTGVNLANFDPSRALDMDLRRDVVRKLADVLRNRHLKTVGIQRI
ncbi:MAG: serine/threonine-protein phosphatase [Deltaproteobacteria bacterium]|jgi:hypothetical protein|nr:serine/threonine-protein phosphatase [Deltaproteobacteria bacterium]